MSSSVRVEVLTPARYRENYDIEHAFLGSKKFCCVLPWSCCGGFGEWRAQREKQAPEHKLLYAVAIDESTDKVLGFVYCCGHGMKCDLHTPKPGELYVEELAVSAEARGNLFTFWWGWNQHRSVGSTCAATQHEQIDRRSRQLRELADADSASVAAAKRACQRRLSVSRGS